MREITLFETERNKKLALAEVAVLRIRIRIHLFYPDPLVRGMDPDPDPSIIMQNSKKNLDSYYFVTLFDFFLRMM